MNKLLRLLKHRWLDEADMRRVLDEAALARLQERVRQSEHRHSGEIRLCAESGLSWSYLRQGLGARARAVTMFGKLRVWDTEHNNGVLIYLLLADHAIEIVADRGVARVVPAEHWQQVVQGMGAAFAAGRFEEGLAEAITAVDNVLALHFALAEGQTNPNELPDRAYLG